MAVKGRAKAKDNNWVAVDWFVEGPTHIVRNLAVYRFILFAIIVDEYAFKLPQAAWAERGNGVETWFTYDQFEFFYDLAPKLGDPVWGAEASQMLHILGIMAGVCAMVGGIPAVPFSFEMGGSLVLILYAFRFFTFVQVFTNHNYLFLLLGILVVVSGGGCYYPPNMFKGNKKEQERGLQRLIQKSEWGAVMIRIQYAIIYFYASVWKMTPDWIDGSICKNIFLSFHKQGVSRGVPWNDLYEEFGDQLFVLVAIGGLLLDSSMFVALTWRRPSRKSSQLFGILSVMFHGFVCFTMSQRIGYTFPVCCLAGSLIFQPIGNDDPKKEESYAQSKKDDDYTVKKTSSSTSGVQDTDEGNLVEWINRYAAGTKAARASRGQRIFALLWALFQVGIPARMPIISRGTFPFTARCYRFSWTMMLHSRSSILMHTGYHTDENGILTTNPFFIPFDMINLYPECADDVPITRQLYRPESAFLHSDPRTLPLIAENHGLIEMRHRALIDQFPRHVARVAGGFSELFFRKAPGACKSSTTGEMRRLSVYGVVYSKLNNKGAFCRIFDPTVNLAEAEQARRSRSVWETIVGTIFDLAPGGHEYLLIRGIGSMNARAMEHEKQLRKRYPNVKGFELIADRAACLAARPLTLWPGGFPIAVVVLEAPNTVDLFLSRRKHPHETSIQKQWDALSHPVETKLGLKKFEMTNDAMIEFSARARAAEPVNIGNCGDTSEEDVLFALLFMQ